jgi:hypothetical protein
MLEARVAAGSAAARARAFKVTGQDEAGAVKLTGAAS